MSLTPEDKIIIWIISLGIAIGLFLYIGGNVSEVIRPSPILVSVFIAIGFSGAIYRFLGGLSGSGMAVGPAKLAGTAAAFMAITWFLNQRLEQQWVNGSTGSSPTQFSFVPGNWLAIDKQSGEPVSVEFKFNDSTIRTVPAETPDFSKRSLALDRPLNGNSGFAFTITAPGSEDTLVLGGIPQSELSRNKLFRSFSNNNSNLFTSELVRPAQQIDLGPELPFLIRTGVFSQNLTRFALVDRQSKQILTETSIALRGGKIYEVNDRLFLIMITQVDHTRSEDQGGQYAKFGVIELEPY